MEPKAKNRRKENQNKPIVRVVFVGGDGLKHAVRFLVKKVLEEKERRERGVLYLVLGLKNGGQTGTAWRGARE